MCDSGVVNLVYAKSEDMAADVFTKGFSDPERWRHACTMIRVGLDAAAIKALLNRPIPPPSEGGDPKLSEPPSVTGDARENGYASAHEGASDDNSAHKGASANNQGSKSKKKGKGSRRREWRLESSTC